MFTNLVREQYACVEHFASPAFTFLILCWILSQLLRPRRLN